MCFSATASFGLGVVLVGAGVLQLSAKRLTFSDPRFLFSCIPILFGIQQISEGFIWLSITYKTWIDWKMPSLYVYLIFAQVIWPFLVPFSFFSMETDPKRKKFQSALTVIGGISSICLIFYLLFYPVHISSSNHHLVYRLNTFNNPLIISGIYYFVPTVIPAFVSSRPRSFLFGIFVLITYLVSKVLFPTAFISVWCYFAALLSLSIYWMLYAKKTAV